MLVSVDVYRPAAREQLKLVAQSINAQIYEGKLDPDTPHGTPDVLRLAKEAKRDAANFGCDILIVDTAGRNQIDAAPHGRDGRPQKADLNPSEILFVADAMTGQDAVNSAKAFNDLLAITGVILTKMDGDARGGAALSIRHITGAPIKFLGTGEKPDAFEPFHPDRIVSRIMGHGDIATLLERAEEHLDRGKAEQFAKKALSGDGFTLEDFREQLRQIKKMGSMKSILKMLPSVGPFAGHAAGRRKRRRRPVHPRRVHHQLHDQQRAPRPRDHQRLPPQAHRHRLRHHRPGGQQPPPPIRPNAQNVQSHGRRQADGLKAQQRMMSQMQGRQKFGR